MINTINSSHGGLMNYREIMESMKQHAEGMVLDDALKDYHRPRLTLRHLHHLRKMREYQGEEREKHLADIRFIYGDDHDCKDSKECDTCKDREKQERKNAKTALKSIKARDKESEEVAHGALGRGKEKGNIGCNLYF